MGDGEHFTLDAIRQSSASILTSFDRQVVEPDADFRAWLVAAGRTLAPPSSLTVAQAAQYAAMSERAIQRLCGSGALGKGA
ncbi:MAG TPA: hypothetical protein VGH09_00290 [Solirubrobacteraceae bacterium]